MLHCNMKVAWQHSHALAVFTAYCLSNVDRSGVMAPNRRHQKFPAAVAAIVSVRRDRLQSTHRRRVRPDRTSHKHYAAGFLAHPEYPAADRARVAALAIRLRRRPAPAGG